MYCAVVTSCNIHVLIMVYLSKSGHSYNHPTVYAG